MSRFLVYVALVALLVGAVYVVDRADCKQAAYDTAIAQNWGR